jgi:hypothetical protein
MAPDTDTELRRDEDAEEALESRIDEMDERVGELGGHIEDARKGLRARREDADEDFDDVDDADDDDDDDPLAFDDPDEDEEDDD